MARNQYEDRLAQAIAANLNDRGLGVRIQTKCNLLYSSIVNDRDGQRVMDVDAEGRAVRRGGAYQQDILLFEQLDEGEIREIPRVSIEIKAGSVTTHDALIYAEKARQLRTVYPYLRFIFVVAWDQGDLPVRLLKAGAAFDAMMIVHPTKQWDSIEEADLQQLTTVLEEEIAASRLLGDVLFRRKRSTLFWRRLEAR